MEHLVGLAVDIDLEAGRSLHGDVVLSVHGDHGYLAQHVEERHGLGVGVLLYVVGHLVGRHLHDGFLCHHLHALQVEAVVDGLEFKAVGVVDRSLGQSCEGGYSEDRDGKHLPAFDIAFHCLAILFGWDAAKQRPAKQGLTRP